MRPHRFALVGIALLLAALTAGVVTLAHASPPDPSWIRGVYDDADGDDAIGLITSGVGFAYSLAPVALRPDTIVIAATVPLEEEPVTSFHSSARQPRAPPAP